jgi:hypothetical protein
MMSSRVQVFLALEPINTRWSFDIARSVTQPLSRQQLDRSRNGLDAPDTKTLRELQIPRSDSHIGE